MGGNVIGIIVNIKTYSVKGDPGKELTEARLIENAGLEGDFHAIGGERQISLLFAESSRPVRETNEKGLCTSRFKENITMRREAPCDSVAPGVRFVVGDALLEVSGETKHCHEECALFRAGKRCSLAGLNLFAKVLKGGVIRVGDEVTTVMQGRYQL